MAYTRIYLAGTYRDGPAAEELALGRPRRPKVRYDHFIEQIHRIKRAARLTTVVVDYRSDFSPGGFAAVESIRCALSELAGAGKHLIFCCEECTFPALYLASACHERCIHPSGELRVLGFARRFLFFKKLLDRFGARATVLRRGVYKSAGDAFRTHELDPANREQYEVFYSGVHHRYAGTIAAGIGKSPEDLAVLTDGHVLPAEQAVTHGWMTEVATVHDVERRLEENKEKRRTISVSGRVGRRGRRVAVLFLDGAICDGESRRDPALGRCVGDRSIGREIRRLAGDRKTAGVILRVNSPGGSAVASESIRREFAHLHSRKPVVVSMGNVAGSGGYWVATEADRVFAEPSTLTGSIGVLMLLLEAETPLKRYGITSDAVTTGRFADLGTGLRRLTREEERVLDTRVEQIYEDFLERAAAARGMSREAIADVAGGRVWSGADAAEVGLVDEVGGLPAAVEWMRRRLEVRRVSLRFFPRIKTSLLERIVRKRLGAELAESFGTGPAGSLGSGLGAAVGDAGALGGGDPAAVYRSASGLAGFAEAAASLQGRVLAVVPEYITGHDL